MEKEFRKNNLVEFEMICKKGEKISAFTGSNGTLGTMILKFSSKKEMLEKMDNMQKWVKVIIKKQ